MRGKDFCSFCLAKKAAFFGWRRHRSCTLIGVLVGPDPVPGGRHDLTPIYALTCDLPDGATISGANG